MRMDDIKDLPLPGMLAEREDELVKCVPLSLPDPLWMCVALRVLVIQLSAHRGGCVLLCVYS